MKVLVVAALLAGCASLQPPGAAAFQVECNVPEAMVVVDDVAVGRASEWSQAGQFIRPGFHRIEIRQPGYYSHFAEIEPAPGGSATVKAELRAVVD